MDDLRVGVIGVGHLGKHHARLLAGLAGAKLVAVADPVQEARETAAETHGAEPYADYRDLEGKLDAVSVVVPTHLHREVAGFFLECGVDVLVEKPISMTTEEGQELVDLAAARERVLQVGHVERFNPVLGALKEQGIEPRYIESHRLSSFSFRSTDIGVVLDLMIHDLDLVLATVRSPIAKVTAYGGSVFTPAEDMASAILEFENGAVAHLTANRVALKPMRRMRMFSKDSYASLDFQAGHGIVIRKNPGWEVGQLDVGAVDRAKVQDLWKYVFEGLLSIEEYKLDEGNPLQEELKAFVATVRSRGVPPVTGEDGVAAVEAAHRVLDQIRQRQW